ncbi:MAG: porin, partial [Deltaproteobacteria bacterium]|nr:porin [Deltaproteobacteria bacterium]
MKKILSLAIGVMLVAMAVPALAETAVDFSGYYRLQHFNVVNYERGWNDDAASKTSMFRHRFQFQLVFHATEEIDVTWQIRAPHWANWGEYGVGARINAQSRAFFATIKQPWGTVRIGRLADGSPGTDGGLFTLGHNLSWGIHGNFYAGGKVFDFDDVVDGITYNKSFDNGFGLAAYYFKYSSNTGNANVKDGDIDRFGIEPRYTWDGGGASLGFIYHRDKSVNVNAAYNQSVNGNYTVSGVSNFLIGDGLEDLLDYLDPGANGYTNGSLVVGTEKDYTFVINPAFTQTWGAFSIGFEGAFAWGKTRYSVYYQGEDPG